MSRRRNGHEPELIRTRGGLYVPKVAAVKPQGHAELTAAFSAIRDRRFEDALGLLVPILEANPQEPNALMLSAVMSMDLAAIHGTSVVTEGETIEPLAEAETLIDAALHAAPDAETWPDAHWCRSIVLVRLGRLEEALLAAEAAIRYARDRFDFWIDYGGILAALGRYDEAMAAWEHAKPTPHQEPGVIAFNEAHIHLLRGNWREGYRLYEKRFDAKSYVRECGRPYRADPAKQWAGQPIPGQRLLVYHEQGLGDALMFWRYLPWVGAQSQAALIVLEVPGSLVRVALGEAGFRTIVRKDDPMPSWDYAVAIFSLPYLHGSVLAVLYDRYRESAVETGEQIKTVREWLIWNADECAKDVEWHLTVPAA